MIDRTGVERWVDGYERAWRTAGTDALAVLFTDDASYRMAPFEEPHRGSADLAALWERERTGPDEPFTIDHEVVAVDGARAVVRLEVRYGAPSHAWYRDLWILEFADDGRVRAFEEWPFTPGQPWRAESHPPT